MTEHHQHHHSFYSSLRFISLIILLLFLDVILSWYPLFWSRQLFMVCSNWSVSTTATATAKSLQSCLTLCDPIDTSPPGSPIPGIFQARTLKWVAISFSNAGKWKVKVKSLSCVWLLATPWTAAHEALHPWDFPGKSTGVEHAITFSSQCLDHTNC